MTDNTQILHISLICGFIVAAIGTIVSMACWLISRRPSSTTSTLAVLVHMNQQLAGIIACLGTLNRKFDHLHTDLSLFRKEVKNYMAATVAQILLAIGAARASIENETQEVKAKITALEAKIEELKKNGGASAEELDQILEAVNGLKPNIENIIIPDVTEPPAEPPDDDTPVETEPAPPETVTQPASDGI